MSGRDIPVSVVVMTRDEAANIADCLAGLERFTEVFVVDSESADGTAALAAAWGARVVSFRWNGRPPKKKQWCLDHLPFSHDWVFQVDADERVTPELADEIAALMARGPRAAGYFVDSRMTFLGRRLRFGARNRKLALFDRRRARYPACDDLDVATMWEVEGHYQPVIEGPRARLGNTLRHEDGKPPYAWFDRHNRYSDWEAALGRDGRLARLRATETGWRRVLKGLAARVPARPLLVFLHGWLWRLGCLDGAAGFHYAVARAFYYWQIEAKTYASSNTIGDVSPASALINSNARRRTPPSAIR